MIKKILIGAALALLAAPISYANISDPLPNAYSMSTRWIGPDSQFVTCAVEDKDGWWWGTDNDGLWRYAPNGKHGSRWIHVRAQDGLYDDSITALCYDQLGRLWVGTERRGVSVYNGSWWRNYDVMNGPLGSHVNAITVNPANGEVWIASEGGLAIYSEKKKFWRYLTQINGLVSDKITCLAFTHTGKIIVGTASDGLMVGNPADNCDKWRSVKSTPETSLNQIGAGLPSNQINCLLINNADKIFCGTASGLAVSNTHGSTWTYQHGYEWPEGTTIGQRVASPGARDYVRLPLADDLVSSLGYDKAGHLYVGHYRRGCEVYNEADQDQLYHTPFDAHGVFIKAIVPTHAGGVLVANYGHGIELESWDAMKTTSEVSNPPSLPSKKFPMPPIPAAAPSPDELKKMSLNLSAIRSHPTSSKGYYLGEDWMTQGNWVGHYGLDFAEMCAGEYKSDMIMSSSPGYSVEPYIGRGGSEVSHWLYWESTGDPRVLFDPAIGTRRQGEWNDHGERYNYMFEGPDLWLKIETPPGSQRITLYFMNKDGHTDLTRYRDFIVQLRKYSDSSPISSSYSKKDALQVAAQTRVSNFWPGVYESFVVNGSGKYYIQIEKNHSLNVILQGVFIDAIGKNPSQRHSAWMKGVVFSPEKFKLNKSSHSRPEIESLQKIWSQLDTVAGDDQSGSLQRKYRLLLLRAAVAHNAPPDLLASWRWSLGVWFDADWKQFEDYVKQTRAALTPPKRK
jgi:hypothetical protein